MSRPGRPAARVVAAVRAGVCEPAAALALGAVLALAGCTSSGSGTASSAPGSPAPDTAVTAPPSLASATSMAQSVSTAPPPTPATSTSRSTGSPGAIGPPACTSAQLKVHALRGSAAAGQEFALITFTNTSSVACTLYGFPGVSLRLNNAPLGQPAGRSAKTPSTVRLAPGRQAEAAITDFSSCQAPVSDTVRVYPPNRREFLDLPLALRGCRVVVDPVTLS